MSRPKNEAGRAAVRGSLAGELQVDGSLAHGAVSRAAEAGKVSRDSVRRWLADPVFRLELESARAALAPRPAAVDAPAPASTRPVRQVDRDRLERLGLAVLARAARGGGADGPDPIAVAAAKALLSELRLRRASAKAEAAETTAAAPPAPPAAPALRVARRCGGWV